MKKSLHALYFLLVFCSLKSQTPGAPDASFGDDGFYFLNRGLAGGRAKTVLAQPDGKIIVVGSTSEISPRFALARLNADGTPDLGFGVEGQVVFPKATEGNDALLQPDGKILVCGNSFTTAEMMIARLMPDGKLDKTFGSEEGFCRLNFSSGVDRATSLALQNDGKIVATGQIDNETSLAVFRLLPNGSLDVDFGTDGKSVITSTQEKIKPSDVEVQADGKILLSCTSTMNGTGTTRAIVYRFLANGSPDTGFGSGGKWTLNAFAQESAYSVLSLSNGDILVAGDHYLSTPPNLKGMLVRLYPNGSIDTGFGMNGVATTSDKFSSFLRVLELPDGKIIAAGWKRDMASTRDVFAARFLSNGTLDDTFGSGGIFQNGQSGVADGATGFARQPNGNLIFSIENAKPSPLSTDQMGVFSMKPNGMPNLNFGNSGLAKVSFQLSDNVGTALVRQKSGKLVSLDYSGKLSGNQRVLIRHSSEGVRDLSFGAQGEVVLPNLNGKMVLLPDDKIFWASIWSDRFVMAQFNADGSPDLSFGTNGVQIDSSLVGYFSSPQVRNWAKLPDGKIIAAGQTWMTRYLPNGLPDLGFGTNGKRFAQLFFNQELVMEPLPDNKIITVAADFGLFWINFFRFNENGDIDTTFGSNNGWNQINLNTMPFSQNFRPAQKILIQTDGKMLLFGRDSGAGVTSSNLTIVRFTENGMLDTDFGNGGAFKVNFNDQFHFFQDAVMLPDGKILAVAGNQLQPSELVLIQLQKNGQPDETHGQGGVQTLKKAEMGLLASQMVLDEKKRPIIAGRKMDENGLDYFLTRIHSTLSVSTETPEILQKIALKISPNPNSNGKMNVQFNLEKPSETQISLWNLQGQRQQTLSVGWKEQGQHFENFEIREGLPAGVYFLKIQSSDAVGVATLILQR